MQVLATIYEGKLVRHGLNFLCRILVLWNNSGQRPPCSPIITISLPLWSKVLWAKYSWHYSHQNGKWWLHQKGFSERQIPSTECRQPKREISLTQKDWVGCATQHVFHCQQQQVQESIPLLDDIAHLFHCSSWRQDHFSALLFTPCTFSVLAFCPCYLTIIIIKTFDNSPSHYHHIYYASIFILPDWPQSRWSSWLSILAGLPPDSHQAIEQLLESNIVQSLADLEREKLESRGWAP